VAVIVPVLLSQPQDAVATNLGLGYATIVLCEEEVEVINLVPGIRSEEELVRVVLAIEM